MKNQARRAGNFFSQTASNTLNVFLNQNLRSNLPGKHGFAGFKSADRRETPLCGLGLPKIDALRGAVPCGRGLSAASTQTITTSKDADLMSFESISKKRLLLTDGAMRLAGLR